MKTVFSTYAVVEHQDIHASFTRLHVQHSERIQDGWWVGQDAKAKRDTVPIGFLWSIFVRAENLAVDDTNISKWSGGRRRGRLDKRGNEYIGRRRV